MRFAIWFFFLAATLLGQQSTFVRYSFASEVCDTANHVLSQPDQGPLSISLTTPAGFSTPDCAVINQEKGARFAGIPTTKQVLRGLDLGDRLHLSVFTVKATVIVHGAPAPGNFGFFLSSSGDPNETQRIGILQNGAGRLVFKIIGGSSASDDFSLDSPTPLQLGVKLELVGSLDAFGVARLFINGSLVASATTTIKPVALPPSSRPSVIVGGAATGFSACNCTIFNAEIRDDAVNYGVPVLSKSVNGASFAGPLAPGAWATITGTNLNQSTEDWTKYIKGDVLPTQVAGTTIKVGGVLAPVYYVSPNQINFLVPNLDQVGTGLMDILATNPFGTAVMKATVQLAAPGWFTYVVDGRSYAAATHASGVPIGRIAGTSPAKRGEVIIVYGTGFGTTDPVLQIDRIPKTLAQQTVMPQVRIGEAPAQVYFAGINGYGGLTQINVVIPSALPDGEWELKALTGGVETPPVYLVIAGDVSQ